VLEAELKLLSGYDFPPRIFRNHGRNVGSGTVRDSEQNDPSSAPASRGDHFE